ncbi:MAG: glycogen debranching protein GlgX [Clostridia bacterium]|nr:glycogen debranching protein GlgX [Clostridia bacterium]
MSHEILKATEQLKPLDHIAGFDVRPGFFSMNGATVAPGGVSFTIHSHYATGCELALFKRTEMKPYAIIPFPENYRIGNVYSMMVFGLNIEEFEYAYRFDGPYIPEKGLIFDKSKFLLDPYARAVVGQSIWGQKINDNSFYKARVVRNNFEWGKEKQPDIPMEDLVIYELHVRAFTRSETSGVEFPGTFAGVIEKIPYLLELGINCVELMPVFEFDETYNKRIADGKEVLECWGYNTTCFFAPNTCYSSAVEYNREGNELKTLVKLLNQNGIEVILDVVFNHTAEGNENGPFFSFKGVDNNIYYMLSPDGKYYNFSGCGNTLNCNHPIVQQMIMECLRYWVVNYRINGFRFDLASILGRNEDGSPMSKPPLLQALAFDPILGNTKLIAEAWDAGGLYQVGSFPSWNRWAEWNGRYRDDMRSFLKGDEGRAQAAALRLTGSSDLYPPETRGRNASVNFLTCHDGFTLYDLYSYNTKHNEANGWNNTDGDNNGLSWNCGAEGDTTDPNVLALRKRMIKNACVALLCSRGTPMFFAGDEFGNTQFGNNNAYCQDNEISWIDWSKKEKNQDIFAFFTYMIHFRKQHEVLRRDLYPSSLGFPAVSTHGLLPWTKHFSQDSRVVGVMFAGRKAPNKKEDIVYVLFNSYWETQEVKLPELGNQLQWGCVINTNFEDSIIKKTKPQPVGERILIGPRSSMILEAF